MYLRLASYNYLFFPPKYKAQYISKACTVGSNYFPTQNVMHGIPLRLVPVYLTKI